MLQEVDMASNTPITDSRFTSLSDLVLANASEFSPLVKESDDETVGALPKQFKACIITDVDQANMTVIDAARTLVSDIEQEHNLVCTLCAYYPIDGHIGWHTNRNVDYYNAICTYSRNGDSFFEYEEDGEVIRVDDTVGWSVKKTYWTSDNPVPHRAVSNTDRITITFSSNVESDIINFMESITSNG